MTSFEDALRRESAKQMAADAQQRTADDHRHRAAEAGVLAFNQLLRDFAQSLRQRGVQPTRFELPAACIRKTIEGDGWTAEGRISRKFFAPEGYIYSVGWHMNPNGSRRIERLNIITSNGRLWNFSAGWEMISWYPATAGFVAITAVDLFRGNQIPIGSNAVFLSLEGTLEVRIEVHDNRAPECVPLEDHLAALAHGIITGRLPGL